MVEVIGMYFPVVNAVIARTRQVVQMPLAAASNAANRGMIMPRPYGMGGHALSMWNSRPRVFGLGTSSTAAHAGVGTGIRPY